jgi:hypothetical protein
VPASKPQVSESPNARMVFMRFKLSLEALAMPVCPPA